MGDEPGKHEPPAIVVVAGATGVGKTALGIELCQHLNGEIVGADSVQVYRGLDIGSSKPTAAELQGVAHHMLDLLAPDQSIDAARYATLASQAIEGIVARGRVPVVVGGTGLWLRALLRGLLPLPSVDPELRAELETQWRTLGAQALHGRLAQVDPVTAAKVHANDQVRVVRALEVYRQTGRPIGELRAAHALGAPRYKALCMVLDIEPSRWHAAIDARIHAMLERGWIDEVRQLVDSYGETIKPLQSVGYRQLVAHLKREVPLEQTITLIGRATRLYGKRQRNWFRTDPDVVLRVDPAQARASDTQAALERHLAG